MPERIDARLEHIARRRAGDLTDFLHHSSLAITTARSDPEAALAHGTRALLLYRGPLLLDQPDADWAHAPRRHAAERHRLLLEALAEASGRLGQPGKARRPVPASRGVLMPRAVRGRRAGV